MQFLKDRCDLDGEADLRTVVEIALVLAMTRDELPEWLRVSDLQWADVVEEFFVRLSDEQVEALEAHVEAEFQAVQDRKVVADD